MTIFGILFPGYGRRDKCIIRFANDGPVHDFIGRIVRRNGETLQWTYTTKRASVYIGCPFADRNGLNVRHLKKCVTGDFFNGIRYGDGSNMI